MESNIIKRIEDSIPNLTAKQKVVAMAILQNPLSVSFLSVKELSEQIDVSPATIVRFAKLITDEGYPQLQMELHEHVQTVSDPIKRMQLNIDTTSEDDVFLTKVYDTQLNNLRKTFSQNLVDSVNKAYQHIMDASHIYTCGSRGSYCISYYLGLHLNRALNNVDIISDNDRMADFMHRVGKGDVVIMVCLPRYSSRLLTVAKHVKSVGAKIIVITDSPSSPFVAFSDIAFFAACNSNDFHNSILPSILIADMLISLLISKNQQLALDNLSEFEQLFKVLKQFNDHT